jgi:hypothetical protein
MGLSRTAAPMRAAGWVCSLLLLVGCQSNSPGMGTRLIANAAMIDFAGLDATTEIADVDVRGGIPSEWEAMPAQSNALFTHRQWRSPSRATGVGIAHIGLPWPVSAKTVIWFAKTQYGKKAEASGGRFIDEWTDALGREWFEAENEKYHVKGYAVTSGFDAWVVYVGYRRRGLPHAEEIGLANRSLESVVPIPMADE